MDSQVLDILQLYEYSMSIGKSLDYDENCNHFLKLILKRNDFNAGWILKKKQDSFSTKFSLPKGDPVLNITDTKLHHFLSKIDTYQIFPYHEVLNSITPIEIKDGFITVFNVMNENFLFFYTKENNSITDHKMNQLLPIIKKFFTTLKACEAFQKQEKLLNQLEERNQELNDYAHVVSHDLKSPLRNISTLTSWLHEDFGDSISEKANNYMDLMKKSIEKMEDLINGILKYSNVGARNEKSKNIDLDKVLDGIIQYIYLPKNIRIIKENRLPVIKGDSYRLHQLFQNLISNAVKYNDKEEGFVRLGCKELKTHYEFSVQDNGVGIDQKYHEKIFTTFQTLGDSNGSSGIGLSIVKKIVNSYDGEIWLESEVGKGTTFYFKLPKL